MATSDEVDVHGYPYLLGPGEDGRVEGVVSAVSLLTTESAFEAIDMPDACFLAVK